MMRRKTAWGLFLLILACCIFCAGCGRKYVAGSKDYNITLITMDQMDVHWVKVNAGVKKAISEAKDKGYTIHYNWYAPDVKDNAKQIEQIDMAASNGSDLIIIAVNSPTACNAALNEVAKEGTKIIYVDSPATFPGEATYATDNYAAGEQAGQKMIQVLTDAGISGGMIGIVSAQAGVQSCIDRVDGFCKALEGTAYTPSEVQYSEGDTAKAQELGTNMINNGAVALFGANEAACVGCGNAAKDARDKIYCVGFDNSSASRTLVKKGIVQAFMAQKPELMGYGALTAALQVLDGGNLNGEVTDTGVTVVTSENVGDFED
ncbi:MAG TPA: substrate-binding domain-containing protein [Lachnospiraceae bacterium]|nr:substrate-binding domain-containing protein [Lachnospiraceae bacterium]